MRFISEARGVADVVAEKIAEVIAADTNDYDSRIEPIYSPENSLKFTVANFKASATIEPLDDKIPINGIFLPDGVTLRNEYKTAWNGAWEFVGQPVLADKALAFMRKDGAEKGSAEREGIGRVVSDITELAAIPEVTETELYGDGDIPYGVSSLLTVWGEDKVNFNVAPAEVIALLDDEISLDQARRLVSARAVEVLTSLKSVREVPGFPSAAVTRLAGVIGFKSNYFKVSIQVADGGERTRNYRVIMNRNKSGCSVVRWEE